MGARGRGREGERGRGREALGLRVQTVRERGGAGLGFWAQRDSVRNWGVGREFGG